MNNIEQKVKWYRNYVGMAIIYEDMQRQIEGGWRIHTCLNKSSDVLVVYERDTLKLQF